MQRARRAANLDPYGRNPRDHLFLRTHPASPVLPPLPARILGDKSMNNAIPGRQRRPLLAPCLLTAAILVSAALAGSPAVAQQPTAELQQSTVETSVLPSRLTQQQPAWRRCAADEPEIYECATIDVPLDYRQPTGTTLTVAISRLRTSTPANRRGILLLNPGGPGGPGALMPLWMQTAFPAEVLSQYDLVGFDQRGVNASSPITCNLTDDEMTFTRILPPYKADTFQQDVERARTVAEKCASSGPTIAHITTRNTARDMDLIREVLREPKASYFGVSYGTYLGAVYTQLFPGRADRVVLDSAVDPGLAWRGAAQAMAVDSPPAFARWAEWTAKRDTLYSLGVSSEAVKKTFWDLVTLSDRKPIELYGSLWNGDRIRREMRRAVFTTQVAAGMIADLKLASAGKDVETPHVALRPAGSPPSDNLEALSWAILCNDVTNWPRQPETYRRDAIRDKKRYPLAGDAVSNIMPCAFWTVPHTENDSTVNNNVESLIVQNEWDPQTPAFMGRGLHRALRGSRLVFVDEGEGHGVYSQQRENGDACAAAVVDRYLSTGVLPSRDVTCRALPQTSKTRTAAPEFPWPAHSFQ
jgi:pimeloyl-ACP methyl ester carboxylesterase